MQNRLNKRYLKLKMRQKEDNKCIVAVARDPYLRAEGRFKK